MVRDVSLEIRQGEVVGLPSGLGAGVGRGIECSVGERDEGGAGAADPRFPGLVLDLQSWNRARQIYRVDADGSVVVVTVS